MASGESSFSIQVPPVEISFSISTRAYFSQLYLHESAASAKAAGKLESEFDHSRIGEHRQRVVTAIVMGAAAIEAAVNEACCDVIDEPDYCRVKSSVVEMFALCWKEPLGLERRSALEKCEVFIKVCARHNPQDSLKLLKGCRSWERAGTLFRLRNLLMHYRPLTITDDGDGGDSQVRKIRAALEDSVDRNAFSSLGNPFYPDRILGYGCASWAFLSAAEFLRDFGDVTGFKESVSYRCANDVLATKPHELT